MIQRETEEIRISMDDLVRAKVELNCGAFFHFAFLHVGRSLALCPFVVNWVF